MIAALAWMVAVPLCVLLGWFVLETLLGLRPLPEPPHGDNAVPPRIVVLVPAHNEEGGVAQTVARILGAATGVEVLVVADNCTDATAIQAARAGARVVERSDANLRGKGYALAHGRDHLAARTADQRPDVVIVLDADCRTEPASLRLLAGECIRTGAPAQARNLLVPDPERRQDAAPGTSPLTQISNFAMLVKNLVRARGLQRLGGGIPLFGTGMAFPWPLFATLPLATGHLAEDMQLALDLARSGVRVRLVEQAVVESAPAPDDAMAGQRGRWERGFLGAALTQGLPMLLGGVAAGSRHRTCLGLHLLVPPLALLLMASGAALLVVGALGLAGAGPWPGAVLLAFLVLAGAAIAAAWNLEGRSTLSPGAALRAPAYVLWKIPLYLGFLKSGQPQWARTRRAGESDGPAK